MGHKLNWAGKPQKTENGEGNTIKKVEVVETEHSLHHTISSLRQIVQPVSGCSFEFKIAGFEGISPYVGKVVQINKENYDVHLYDNENHDVSKALATCANKNVYCLLTHFNMKGNVHSAIGFVVKFPELRDLEKTFDASNYQAFMKLKLRDCEVTHEE